MSDLRVTGAGSRARSVAAPGRELLRPGAVRTRDRARSSPRGPRYVGHELAVPERRRLPRPAAGRRGPRPGAHAGRRASWSPTSAGTARRSCCAAAATPAATSSARCTAGPTTCKGELIGAPHFADDPCLDLHQLSGCRPGTACCSKRRSRQPAATSPPTWPASARVADLDFTGYVLRQRRAARVRLQLEDLHRGLPRGLPRRPVPPRARPVRHLRGPALGVRTAPLGADRRAEERARQAGLGRLPQVARRGARLSPGPLRRPGAQARRDLAHLLPGDDGRVVPARAGGLDAASRRARTRR